MAVDRARKGLGPTMIESIVVRLLPHSSSDDHKKYRTEKSIEDDKMNDPIKKFKNECIKNKTLSNEDLDKLEKQVQDSIDKDTLWAEQQEDPTDYKINLFSKENKFNVNLKEKDNDIV